MSSQWKVEIFFKHITSSPPEMDHTFTHHGETRVPQELINPMGGGKLVALYLATLLSFSNVALEWFFAGTNRRVTWFLREWIQQQTLTRGSLVSFTLKGHLFPKSISQKFPTQSGLFPTQKCPFPKHFTLHFSKISHTAYTLWYFSPRNDPLTCTTWAPTTFPIKYFTLPGYCFWNKNNL